MACRGTRGEGIRRWYLIKSEMKANVQLVHNHVRKHQGRHNEQPRVVCAMCTLAYAYIEISPNLVGIVG